jgi:glycosyltransferase involved in cell wall biosynthesis
LNQTYPNLEVVVVIDGPDPETAAAIEALDDARIRVIALAESVGGSDARNTGVRESKGKWIAFLDDDDEWLPEKTEKQTREILRSAENIVFSACRYHFADGVRSSVQPEVFPRAGENISEYLFCELTKTGRRRSFMQTSTWLVRRDFCLRNPFTSGLKRHQDTDWLLMAYANNEVAGCFVAEPYAVFHCEPDRTRVGTKSPDWKFTFEWANEKRLQLTPKAKAYVYATFCAHDAKPTKDGMKLLYSLWKQCDPSVRFTPQLLVLFSRAMFSACTYRSKYVRVPWLWLRNLVTRSNG